MALNYAIGSAFIYVNYMWHWLSSRKPSADSLCWLFCFLHIFARTILKQNSLLILFFAFSGIYMFFQFEMQPDAFVKQKRNYEIMKQNDSLKS